MELVQPGLGLVVWMLIAFGIVLLLLKRYAWKPILGMMQKREQTIDEALHAADRAREEMEKLKVDNEKLLLQAKEERDEILRDARKVSEGIIDKAKDKANEEADRIIENAKESIHYEKMAALTELKNQIAVLSIEIAEKVLKEELSTEDKHQKLIEKSLDEVKFN